MQSQTLSTLLYSLPRPVMRGLRVTSTFEVGSLYVSARQQNLQPTQATFSAFFACNMMLIRPLVHVRMKERNTFYFRSWSFVMSRAIFGFWRRKP